MTTSSTTVDLSSFTTDAKFRAWSSTLSAAIIASGLTQTSDTGQINHTTVTKAVAANTKVGYEIYRFNDTLQSTKPIFLRLDYGSGGNASGNAPGTWLTVGTGSDGAGNITGVGMAVTQGHGTSTTATTNATTLVGAAYSTAAGTCTILAGMLAVTSTHTGMWVVSRTCDSSTGAPDGNGVVVTYSGNTTGPFARGATFSPATAWAATNPGCGVPQVSASVSSGGSVQLYKHYAVVGALFPIMGVVSFYSSDVVGRTTFTAAPFGSTSRTYMALSSDQLGLNSSQSAGISGAVIWE